MPTARLSLYALVLVLAFASSACLGAGHSVNAYGGTRFLDASEWDDIDNPIVYGIDGVLKVDLPWLGVEGGWFHSEEDDDTVGDLTVDDYFVGLRVTPWKILIEPYASAGVTYVDSGLDAGPTSEDDQVFAYYLRLGAAFSLGIVRLGLDGRALIGTDVDFGTLGESDVDGYQLTAFVGLGF